MNQNLDAPGAVRGQNVLKDARRKTLPECFLEQLNDPLIFILFVAAAISMLLGEVSDTAIILAVILVNALVGVIQEGRAQKALDALKDCEGVIIFTDLMGGTPFNTAAQLGRDRENVRILAGTNLPMLVEVVMSRKFMDDLDGLVDSLLQTGKEQVAKFEFKQALQEEPGDEDGI